MRISRLLTRSTPILLAAILLAPALPLPAQQDTASTPPPTAPSTIVRTARLSFFSGDLKVQRADNTGEDAAALNMPLTAGTRLVTGDAATAEVEFEDGSIARLTPHSSLSIDTLSLDPQNTAHTELTLLNGLAYFELRQSDASTYLIDADGIDASPAENTVFRIALNEPPPVFAVFSGSIATASQQGFSATVKSGESLRPDPEDPTRYFLNPQLATSTWDAWNQSRDQLAADQAASRTAARDAYAGAQGDGWSDLDANGTWYSTSDSDGSQDDIWQPAAAAGDDSGDSFDPYGDGAFVWTGANYSWASAYTWGWLPYRCGRWIWYPGFGWAWKPNRFCGTFGFQAGGISIGHHPPRYKIIHIPFPRPEPIHPILRVHSDVAPRPKSQPAASSSETRLAGNFVALPLPVIGAPALAAAADGGGGTSSVVGSALYRDYPVELASRQPIFGTLPTSTLQRPVIPGETPIWTPHPGSPTDPRPITLRPESTIPTNPRSETPHYDRTPSAPRSAPPPPARSAPSPPAPSTSKPK
jgi:hypothetical protein